GGSERGARIRDAGRDAEPADLAHLRGDLHPHGDRAHALRVRVVAGATPRPVGAEGVADMRKLRPVRREGSRGVRELWEERKVQMVALRPNRRITMTALLATLV